MDANKDRKLIQKYKAGEDLRYLSQLYEAYLPLVYGVCLKYLGQREAAQDAVMDIYEKLAQELLRHETPEVFKPWLYVLVKNFCLMRLRKEKSQQEKMNGFVQESVESESFVHPLDEDPQEEREKALQACMEKLKEQQRICLQLFYYEKKCYQEIAALLSFTEKQVKSDLQNGKRNLKNCIEKQSE